MTTHLSGRRDVAQSNWDAMQRQLLLYRLPKLSNNDRSATDSHAWGHLPRQFHQLSTMKVRNVLGARITGRY
jgi:hypothetical protein